MLLPKCHQQSTESPSLGDEMLSRGDEGCLRGASSVENGGSGHEYDHDRGCARHGTRVILKRVLKSVSRRNHTVASVFFRNQKMYHNFLQFRRIDN